MIDSNRRCHCLSRGACASPEHTSFAQGQRQALPATPADPSENKAEQILTAFQRLLVYTRAPSGGELLVCDGTTADELDETDSARAIELAKQMFDATGSLYPLLIPGGALNPLFQTG